MMYRYRQSRSIIDALAKLLALVAQLEKDGYVIHDIKIEQGKYWKCVVSYHI